MSRDVSMIDMSLPARPLNPYVTLWWVSEPSWWHDCGFCDWLYASDYSDLSWCISPFSWFPSRQACLWSMRKPFMYMRERHMLEWSRQCLRLVARRCHAEIPSTRTFQAAGMAPPQKLGQKYYELELVGLGKSRLQHISGCVSISESVSQLATHTFQMPTVCL